jgi:ABC-2 type transport system ATP-binding protein
MVENRRQGMEGKQVMTIVSFEHVSRRYGSNEALHDISFAIDKPQVIGLLGRNGAGKSTLLRMIPPLIHPTSGKISVFGKDPWDFQEANKLRLGYLADSDVYLPGIRAKDLLDLCADVYPTWDRALVDRFIKKFSLSITQPLANLSKGQQRQVGLLCAIGHRPELLILDEPAGGLDPVARRDFLGAIIELMGESGSTVLFASHLFADVERLAERIIILHQGVKIADAPLDELKTNCCRLEFTVGAISERQLRSMPECFKVETTATGIFAVLRLSPREAAQRIKSGFGVEIREVQSVGLEELFIHWTGQPS